MATTFSYSDATGKTHTMKLRHNPYNVNWSYNLNTNIIDTYAGQVVQVLSVKIDRLTIEGQLADGPRGRNRDGDRLVQRDLDAQFSYSGTYVGLHGMTEFFREYFALVSQGQDKEVVGQFRQVPMSVNYDVEAKPDSRHWPGIIPVSFPSFRRANDNFAPMWKIEAYVWEADRTVHQALHKQALKRLKQGVGYKAANEFSDPKLNFQEIRDINTNLIEGFKALLPSYTRDELYDMIWNNVSVPRFVDQTRKVTEAAQNAADGETARSTE
jgi:hypothetical protein